MGFSFQCIVVATALAAIITKLWYLFSVTGFFWIVYQLEACCSRTNSFLSKIKNSEKTKKLLEDLRKQKPEIKFTI
jgi:hypothetical protein